MSVNRVLKKFNAILSSHQKLRIAELVMMMIVGGVLETLSVSLILPFMDMVMNPGETMKKPYVKWVCELLDIHSPRTFMVIVALTLAVLYVLKNAYLLLEYNVQYRFVYGNMFMMQRKLLNAVIHRSYEYFLGISSGEVIRMVNVDTDQVFSLLSTLLFLFTELVVSGMLVAAVFVMAPMITVIMAAVLVSLVIAINQLLKPVLRQAGKDTQRASAGMNKWLLQSVQGIKELKVMNKDVFFEENYNRYGQQYVGALRKNNVLQVVPRFFIEATCMSSVFIIVAVLIFRGADIESMLPVLSAIAIAAMRLLPSVNRVSNALASISYGEPMLDKLVENLQNVSGQRDVNLETELNTSKIKGNGILHGNPLREKIELSEVSYKYPTSDVHILSEASLNIECGQSIGLVGTTGAGKTTTVDILLGLLLPQSGQVMVDGADIHEDMRGWLSEVGYIPQMIFMLDDTIRANVAFGEDTSGISDENVWRALREASLEEFVRSLPNGLDTEIGERGVRLSGGQRQRIGIARALYLNPSVLIFDEATSALDNETEKDIMDAINHLHGRKTMIIIAHRLSTIENCDHVYRVENGKIVKER